MAIQRFKIPGLQTPSSVDGELRAFLEAAKERLELLSGERGDPEQRTVTLRELKDAGVAGVRTSNQFARLVAPRTPESSSDNTGSTGEVLDLSLLPQVNLAEASGELQFLLQGTTTNDRFKLLVGDMLAIFGRLDQESAPQFPWSFEAEGYGLDITGIAPRFRFVEQAEGDDTEDVLPDDSAIWDSIADSGVFEFRLRADDDESGATVWSAGRTGLNPDFFNVYADVLGVPVDGAELQIGAGADLRLFHDGTNSTIRNDTGQLNVHSDAAMAVTAVANFSVAAGGTGQLASNGTLSLLSGASHVALQGTEIRAISGPLRVVADNQELQIGAGNDLRLFHDGTDSFIVNDTGLLRVDGQTEFNLTPTAGGVPVVLETRQVLAGTGLAGGGDLSADVTLELDAAVLAFLTNAVAATLLTETDETATFPNSRRLVAGTNITFDATTPGELEINASGGGSVPDPLLLSNGSVAAPTYSFAADPDTGIYLDAVGQMSFAVGGVRIFTNTTTVFQCDVSARYPDGSANVPGWAFKDDSDTGIYRPSANRLNIATGGVVRAYFDSTFVQTDVPLYVPDGSAVVPGFGFALDINTGIYRIGIDTMGFATAGTLGLVLDSTQRVYGTALHNNASLPTGTTNQYIASGTYTPTPSATSNLDAITPNQAQWMRVGNVATVSGDVTVDPTVATVTVFELSLPIASAFTATTHCAGAGAQNFSSSPAVLIRANATNDTAQFVFTAGGTSSQTLHYTYTYVIL